MGAGEGGARCRQLQQKVIGRQALACIVCSEVCGEVRGGVVWCGEVRGGVVR